MTHFPSPVPWNNWRAYQKPVLILAIFLLSAYFGRSANPRLALNLATGVGGLISFVVLMRHPALGLGALIVVSMVFKPEIRTGTAVNLNFSVFLPMVLLAVWLIRMFKDRDIRLVPSRTNLPAIGFVLATTVSLFAGNLNWIFYAQEKATLPAQFGGWLLYVLPMGIFLLAANQIKDTAWLSRLVWLFLVIGGAYIAVRLTGNSVLRETLFVPTRSLGSVFWIWLTALAFAQFLLNDSLRPWWRISLGFLTAATFYVGLKQTLGWFSGWIPPLVAVFVIAWLSSWRMRWLIIAGAFLILLVEFESIYSWLTTSLQEYTVYSRQATYPIMLELIKANPILGLGPSNYRHYTNLYPILGWYVKFNSHNNYVDIVAQTGLIGFSFFTWLVYEIARLGWKLRMQIKSGFNKAYVYAGIGGLVGTLFSGLLGDWFLPFVYNVGMPGFRASVFAWFFLGGLIVIEKTVRQTRGENNETAG
jgi:O-antigen ligase